MAKFKIDGKATVKKLKENFENEVEPRIKQAALDIKKAGRNLLENTTDLIENVKEKVSKIDIKKWGSANKTESMPNISDVQPQNGQTFLNYVLSDLDSYRHLLIGGNAKEMYECEEDLQQDYQEFHEYIMGVLGDIYNGEPLVHAFCNNLLNGDGVYMEVKETEVEHAWQTSELYCTYESKVYIVENNEIVYYETLSKYMEDLSDFKEE